MKTLVLAILLAGCATLPGDPVKMTAEQITAAVKDKSATIGCGAVQTPYKINTVLMNLDRGVLPAGTEVSISSDCTVTWRSIGVPR